MSIVARDTSKRLLAIHGWSAVIAGLFLYVVILTGSVAVLAQEIGVWSISGAQTQTPFSQPLDRRIKELATSVDPKYTEDVFVSPNPNGSLIVFFHTHGTNNAGAADDLGVRFILEPSTLKILKRDEGYGMELPGDPASALDSFIATLHISLHAPNPIGLYVTGLAGFVMLFAVISGIILHRHLIKDLFVAPRQSSRLLNKRDRHILAGSWSLPFGFLVAFTGSFFSFAGALGLPIVAMVSFGGDQVKMVETLVGAPPSISQVSAPMANLDTILRSSTLRVGTQPMSIGVIHWGKVGAKALVTHGATGTAIEGSSHIYDMETGVYEGVKPDVGTKPSLGGKVLALMAPLHFGSFAGLMSKFIWVALGLATCYVTLTGLRLWVERRADQPGWRWLGDAIPTIGYGVPLGLVGASIGFLVSYASGDPLYWTAAGFVIASILALSIGVMLRARLDLSPMFLVLLSGGLLLLPLLRMVMSGADWVVLAGAGQTIPIMVDLIMLSGAAFALWTARKSHVPQLAAATAMRRKTAVNAVPTE